jgi:hypothetical protein
MDINSATLQQMLEFLGNYRYKSWGFQCFILSYSHFDHSWRAIFRNPKDLVDPRIKADSPEEACRQMIEFLKGLKTNEA